MRLARLSVPQHKLPGIDRLFGLFGFCLVYDWEPGP